MQIWDTAGQERFRTITQSYYKSAQGIMLCYDCTNQKTFDGIAHWLQQIRDHASTDIEKCLVATKCDKESKVIDSAKGLELAQEHGMSFFETSSMTGQNC